MSTSKNFSCANSSTVSSQLLESEFYDFYKILLTKLNDVEYIISRVETIKSISVAKLSFQALFKIIYDLAKSPDTELKVDNIVIAIDTFDNQLPQILIDNSQEPATEIMTQYFDIRKASFESTFQRIQSLFDPFVETKPMSLLNEFEAVLLVLAKISRMRYYEDYVYHFVECLWNIFETHSSDEKVVMCVLQALRLIIDRVVKFLLLKIEDERFEENKIRADYVANIIRGMKEGVVGKRFTSDMLKPVLHMLDLHDRFIGQFVDAVPENTLHKKGYVIYSSNTCCLEQDDVYDDYEEFLSGI